MKEENRVDILIKHSTEDIPDTLDAEISLSYTDTSLCTEFDHFEKQSSIIVVIYTK